MIESVPDLQVNKKTYFETMFIFAFFAVNVNLVAGISVAFRNVSNGQNLSHNLIVTLEVLYCFLSLTYVVCYLCYINIL